MKTKFSIAKRTTCIFFLATVTLFLLLAQSSFAGSATWLASPAAGDWNTAGNWTAGGPPNGSADTATFATSNITGVSISAFAEVTGVVFNAGASVVHNHRQHHEAVDH